MIATVLTLDSVFLERQMIVALDKVRHYSVNDPGIGETHLHHGEQKRSSIAFYLSFLLVRPSHQYKGVTSA